MLLIWEDSFATDPQLSLIKMTIAELTAQGVNFNTPVATANPSAAAADEAAREEEELNFALAASLSMAEVGRAMPAASFSPPALGRGSSRTTALVS